MRADGERDRRALRTRIRVPVAFGNGGQLRAQEVNHIDVAVKVNDSAKDVDAAPGSRLPLARAPSTAPSPAQAFPPCKPYVVTAFKADIAREELIEKNWDRVAHAWVACSKIHALALGLNNDAVGKFRTNHPRWRSWSPTR